MSRTTDYVIENGIDVTDPQELSIEECHEMLDDDAEYLEWTELLDKNFEEVFDES